MDGRGSIKVEARHFLFSAASRPVLVSTRSPIQWLSAVLSPGITQPESEAAHSSPTGVEVKNGEATPPLPHTS
jgi:hypothetical protein